MRCAAGTECKRPSRWARAVSGRPLAGEVGTGRDHMFAGYELYAVFHPECCPGFMDGSPCEQEHPEGWEPADREVFEGMLAEEQVRREAFMAKWGVCAEVQRGQARRDSGEGLAEFLHGGVL